MSWQIQSLLEGGVSAPHFFDEGQCCQSATGRLPRSLAPARAANDGTTTLNAILVADGAAGAGDGAPRGGVRGAGRRRRLWIDAAGPGIVRDVHAAAGLRAVAQQEAVPEDLSDGASTSSSLRAKRNNRNSFRGEQPGFASSQTPRNDGGYAAATVRSAPSTCTTFTFVPAGVSGRRRATPCRRCARCPSRR